MENAHEKKCSERDKGVKKVTFKAIGGKIIVL
jgi:hypothetical protein